MQGATYYIEGLLRQASAALAREYLEITPGGGSGDVTHTGALTLGQVVVGNGVGDLKVLASPPNDTQFLNGAATPAFASVKDSDLSTSDILTNNATAAKHGFLPKLSGNSAQYFAGDGTWQAVPAGGAGTVTNALNLTSNAVIVGDGGTVGVKSLAALGSSGQVLTSNGAGVPPSFQAPTGGAGTVTNTGTLTDHGVVVGNGGVDVSALAVGTNNTVLHGVTGADPAFSAVVESDLALTDVATANAATGQHGFLKKLSNVATDYMDGQGNWSTPPGSAIDYWWDYMEASLLLYGTTTSFPYNCTRAESTLVAVNPTATEPPGGSITTSASIGNVVSHATSLVNQFIYNRPIDFRCVVATGATITSYRIWGAVLSGAGISTLGASDLAAAVFCGFRFSTNAGDANWMCCFNDNAGNSEALSSGVAVAASTVYRLRITWDGTTTGKVKYYINGTLVQTSTFDFPTLSKFMMASSLTTLANATRTYVVYGMKIRQYYP
jgi:hypothetical protein